jgi:site-specific DNA-cytosine methylase
MAYVEIEAYIVANLVAGMEAGILDPAPIWTDAKTFDARPFRGRIHGIVGGYPCPGESLAGLREGHLYKGFLWPAIRRTISATRPLFCFFENVDDHLTGTYPIVQRSLLNMGYRTEAGIYSAREVGASQERKRIFILALANSYSSKWRSHIAEIISDKRQSNLQWREKSSDSLTPFGENMEQQELAYCSSKGLEGLQQGQLRREGTWPTGSITECRPQDFPLGQGFEQWEWEEPREIESSMGSTIHGYDFAGDLLRALGNSVVEQTAELAFIDLLQKHLKNV